MLGLSFFLSGFSALLFQIIICRQFGLVFGNTSESSAVVIGTFLLGLGAGSYFGGKLADGLYFKSPKRLLLVYGAIEISIAVLSLSVVANFSYFETVSAYFSSYARESSGFYSLSFFSVLVRCGIALLLVFPIAALMGATLPLVLRLTQNSAAVLVGKSAAILYGVNTLGAALACLAADSFLIPALGLLQTQLAASLMNIFAALLILIFKIDRPSADNVTAPAPSNLRFSEWLLVFTSGFAAIGLEIIWFRIANISLGSRRIVLSLLLFGFLMGVQAGSIFAIYLIRKVQNKISLLAGLQTALVISTIVAMLAFTYVPDFPAEPLLGSKISEAAILLWPIIKLLGLSSFIIGAIFPVIFDLLQSGHFAVARSAGRIMLVNSMGSFAATVAFGFILIPLLGIKGSVVAVALLLMTSIALLKTPAKFKIATLTLSVAAIGTLLLTEEKIFLNTFTRFPADARIIEVSESGHDTSAAVDYPNIGRALVTSGVILSTNTLSDQRYMRAFAHIPLLMHAKPETALVICYGVGNTASAVAAHSGIRRLDIADISRSVLGLSVHFNDINHNVLSDFRVKVFVNDGRQHLRMQPSETYDFITSEPPPLYAAGVESLYNLEFNQLAYRSLKPGGFMSVWLPIWHLHSEHTLSLVRSFVSVFENTLLIEAQYGHYILIGRKVEPILFSAAQLAASLAARPSVKAELEAVNLASPAEFFGSFAGSSANLKLAVADSFPLTDLRPLLEYTPVRYLNSDVPIQLFHEVGYQQWCSDCSFGDTPDYISIMSALRRHEKYVKISPGIDRAGQSHPGFLKSGAEAVLIEKYPYLRRIHQKYVRQ